MAARGKGRGGRAVFRFQLGWGGLAGVVLVLLCLFGWMFLMGVWAGQTILFPLPGKDAAKPAVSGGKQPSAVEPVNRKAAEGRKSE